MSKAWQQSKKCIEIDVKLRIFGSAFVKVVYFEFKTHSCQYMHFEQILSFLQVNMFAKTSLLVILSLASVFTLTKGMYPLKSVNQT